MKRTHIDLPQQWLFHTSITVQISDINYGNHLANDAVLRLCHEARLRFLQCLGYTEMNTAGHGLILTDASIQFHQQGFYGDQLKIAIGILQISKIGFVLVYQLVRQSDQKIVATVKTTMVFFDYTTQRPQKTPLAFQLALKKVYNHA